VAALIHWQIRKADTDFEHRFVAAEFSSKLIRRRKIVSAKLARLLPELFEIRIDADYRLVDVSSKVADQATRSASVFVSEVAAVMESRTLREVGAHYGGGMKTKVKKPEDLLEEHKATILANYPDVDFRVKRRGERDFTLEVYGDYPDMWEVRQCLGDMTIDTLVDHDVWIVVLCLPRHLGD